MMVEFHRHLSERSVYYRYFSPLELSCRTSHERLTPRCFVDFDRELALIAEHIDDDGKVSIAGVARLMRDHSGNSAEIAFVVSDKFQHKGLGTYLLEQTTGIAKQEGISSLHAVVLNENSEMKNLFRRAGFTLSEPEAGVVAARLDLH